MMTRKHLAALLAIALVFAACSGAETRNPDSSSPVISLGSSPTTEGGGTDPTTPGPTSEATGSPSTESPSNSGASLSVTPALGITGSASDSFDTAGLVEGPGSGFVPMDNPVMVPASDVTWLNDDSVVMGVAHSSGESHAYPVGQMAYHHIANTTVAGEPFLVTY